MSTNASKAELAWNAYIDEFGHEPGSSNQLRIFSMNRSDIDTLNYKQAREAYESLQGKTDDTEMNINIEYFTAGYIRQFTKLTKINIPIDVIKLIQNYYPVSPDKIDLKKIGSLHTLNGNIITQTKPEGSSGFEIITLFSRQITDGVHCWKFKVLRNYGRLKIGIYTERKNTSSYGQYQSRFTHSYGYQVSGWKLTDHGGRKYGKNCYGNDIVSMIYDADNYILRYEVNGDDQGVAFDKSKIVKTWYKAAIFTWNKGESVEFIEYQLLS